jgi:hypothetical protein
MLLEQNKDGLNGRRWHPRNDKYDNLIACIFFGSFDPFLSRRDSTGLFSAFNLNFGMRVGKDWSFICFWLGMAEVGCMGICDQ